MTLEFWIGIALGIGVGALWATLHRQRTRAKASDSATLVPHRTREVISALPSGALVLRRDMRAAFSNQAAGALGLARPDGAVHDEVARLATLAWDTEEAVQHNIQVRKGVLAKEIDVHVRVVPLNPELALVTANDNTQERAAERERREFAVNVSHELKTPVGALSLLAETVEAAADDPETVLHFAKKIRKEARRLTRLIQEIIEISRLQGGDSVIDHVEINVADVIAAVVESAAIVAETRKVTIRSQVRADATVMGNLDQLTMAVRNLLENAISYSNEGSHVTIASSVSDDLLSIGVFDQGIGISPEDQERIFERFFRTDPARSRETGGTGLGLSIVKHVANQHGGDVQLWSKLGVGSTFTLRLPVYTGEPDEIELGDSEPPARPKKKAKS